MWFRSPFLPDCKPFAHTFPENSRCLLSFSLRCFRIPSKLYTERRCLAWLFIAILRQRLMAPYAGFDTIPRISRSKDSLYETGRPVPDIVSFRIKFSFAMISDNLFVASSILNTFWVAFEKIAKIDCKQSYCWPSSARMSVLYTIIGLTIRWFSQFQAQALTSFMTLLRSLSTLKRKYLIWSCSVNTRHPR